MKTMQAHIPTEHGERYIARLCRHFSHKVATSCEGPEGEIHFDMGTCKLEASGAALVLRAEAPDDASLTTVGQVVASHLERFAANGKEGEVLTAGWEASVNSQESGGA